MQLIQEFREHLKELLATSQKIKTTSQRAKGSG